MQHRSRTQQMEHGADFASQIRKGSEIDPYNPLPSSIN